MSASHWDCNTYNRHYLTVHHWTLYHHCRWHMLCHRTMDYQPEILFQRTNMYHDNQSSVSAPNSLSFVDDTFLDAVCSSRLLSLASVCSRLLLKASIRVLSVSFSKIAKNQKKNRKKRSKKCFSIFPKTMFLKTTTQTSCSFSLIIGKFFFHSKEHAKAQGTSSSDFLKEAFFMPQKSRPKNLHVDFWPFFEDLNLWKLFCACKLTFQKLDDDVPCVLMCSFEWIRRFLRLFIKKNKMSGLGKEAFFAIVRLITFLNKHISGWNFYQRLSALGPTYPKNFSLFGRSWAKIDFWVGGLKANFQTFIMFFLNIFTRDVTIAIPYWGIGISITLRKRYLEKTLAISLVWSKVFVVVESESMNGFPKFWKKFLLSKKR